MRSNDPAGAGCRESLTVLQRLFPAAQPDHYAQDYSLEDYLELFKEFDYISGLVLHS
ncbi:MAG TPA: hypothetical protein V6C84_26795 [Coleofasciculaceae cyanobacterium]|jgi:hypothetical protein